MRESNSIPRRWLWLWPQGRNVCQGKRLTILLILLITTVMGVKADGYITDVMVYGKKSDTNPSMSGWSRLTKNLNAGTGDDSWDIFLFYKTSTTANPETGYITDIVVRDKCMTNGFDWQNRHYTLASTNSSDFNGDLNRGAGGADIYLYYTRDRAGLTESGGQKRVITGFTAYAKNDAPQNPTPVKWYDSEYSGAADMNKGAGGDYIFINMNFTEQTLSLTGVTGPTFYDYIIYDGTAKNLVKTQATNYSGTMKYKIGDGQWKESATATDVGSYSVKYRLDASFANSSAESSASTVVIYPVVKAKNLSAVFSQEAKNVHLEWSVDNLPNNYSNYKWTVYRGNTKIKTLNPGTTFCDDTGFENEKNVTYSVYFISGPRSENTKYDDAKATATVSTRRTVPVNNLQAVSSDDRVTLTWTSKDYSAGMNNKFDVYIDDVKVTTITPTTGQTSFTWEHRDNNALADGVRNDYAAYSEENLDACTLHDYKVVGQIGGTQLNSATVKDKAIGSGTTYENFECSKGEYQGTVLLKWNVKRLEGQSQAETYVIERRVKTQEDDEDAWQKLTTLDSDKTFLTWEDKTPLPGVYYEYRITCYNYCSNGNRPTTTAYDTGFALSSGVVSGRITYGTGTAVSDVKVTLHQNNESGESFNHMRSLEFSGANAGFRCITTNNELKKLLAGDFTVQAYVYPDNGQMNTNGGNYYLMDVYGLFSIQLQYNSSAQNYKLGAYSLRATTYNTSNEVGDRLFTNLTIPAKKWSHVSLVFNKSEQKFKFYVTTDVDHIVSDSITGHMLDDVGAQYGFTIANSWNLNQPNFRGNLDEFRFFKRALTQAEIGKNYNHPLGGIEDGLAVYYPMDENMGVQDIVYDFSKSNNTSNGHHAKADVPATSSENVPSEEQLSLMGLTDAQGNYVIRGVPFSGEGTNYTVKPQYGNHDFSPTYLSRYVSASSLVHSGVDFEDVSSFPVSGNVRYAGTDYPVEGCYIYVDDQMCAKNGEPVTTDADGNFTVSVSIGDHHLQVKLNGHTFVDGGRFPPDPKGTGLNEPFVAPVSGMEFIDETLANFTGRVVGGSIEGTKPVGFGLSENNIGVVEMVLSPLNDKYRMNVIQNPQSSTPDLIKNSAIVTAPSATDAINSTSWRGKDDFCKKIYIRTDPSTGEFSAMLPPLQYQVESMKVVKSQLEVGSATTIDLTNPQRVLTDSTRTEKGELLEYEYNVMLRKEYHCNPSFSVTQKGSSDGHFGIDKYEITDDLGTITINDIYSVNQQSGAITYKYGGAVFVKDDPYTFLLEGYEEYINDDGETPVISRVPMSDVTVTIDNALSDGQSVYCENGKVGDRTVTAGEVEDLKSNQMVLDDEGKGTYTWHAGLPNITEPYYRTINISYEIDGTPYEWSGNGFRGIILGELPTGSNFVTQGPDKLTTILRDPPGSESSAEWSYGSSTTETRTHTTSLSESFEASNTFQFGYTFATITGTPCLGTVHQTDSDNDLKIGIKEEYERESSHSHSQTVTVTRAVSTKGMGDVFIGNATNLLFGKARMLNFHRSGNGVELGLSDIITTGLQFGTAFNYSQTYIEETLLPNWEKIRNRLLTTVANQDSITNYTNKKDKSVYLTLLTKDDPDYGKPGTYTQFGPADLHPDSVAVDSVLWINTQIGNWIRYLTVNEEEKVKAYEKRKDDQLNFSFDSGADVSYSIETDWTTASSWSWTISAGAVVGDSFGFHIAGLGFQIEMESEVTTGSQTDEEYEHVDLNTYAFTLADDGDYDAFSVDVYEYGSFSPIFRTRGGQSSGPYEGEVRTKYYTDENGDHPVIMEATMQIEVPQIDVEKPRLNNIPSGEAANYVLKLSNASAIGADVAYRLMLLDETNENGAQLMMDGMPLTGEGRLIKVPGNQTLTKALQLRQTNTGVLDYEDIGIVFASDSEPDEIFDVVYISAHFVPSASAVDLALSNNIMNTQTGTDLKLTFSNFDRNYNNQKAFRLQYKKQGSTGWTLLHEYVLDENDPDLTGNSGNKELLPDAAKIDYTLPMSSFTDGEYLFRVLSVATYAGEVTRSSEELSLVKDMQRPRPLGQPEPADGILSPGDEMSVTFNEAILKGELTQAANFKVTGVLNGAELAHETALSMQNTDFTAKTEADIMLAGKDFSIDMWVNLNGGAGTLLSHGKGTAKMSVGTDAANHLVVKIGTATYTSENTIPTGKWVFLSMSLGNGKLNATAAKDADEIVLFSHVSAVAYEGNGPLTVGQKISGAMHELLLWDEAHDMGEALFQRSRTKSPATRHLIGYWKMDEGEGTTIRDYARNRHLTMSNETWYMNNVNKSVSLTGGQYLQVDASALPTYDEDDYAVEFWMRGGTQAGVAWLLQMGEVGLWLNANGELQLTGKGAYLATDEQTSLATTSGNLADNAWHHIALNVLRQGAAAVYVDGVRRLTTNATNVGSIATNLLLMGTHRQTVSKYGEFTYDSPFTGQVDELRVWNATLNADKLLSNRRVRLTGSEDGLVAYYPFETKEYGQNNLVVTVTTAADFADGSDKTATVSSGDIAFSDEAPAMRAKKMETNVPFTFVASNEKIVITIDEDPATIEGCTLNFTVRDVRDENGNYSVPAVWSAFINKNQLVWADNSMNVELLQGTASTLTAIVMNKGGQQQMWTLSGLPAWLDASVVSGETNPLSETEVDLTILPSAPLGRHEVTVYLTGNDNIDTPLTLNVKVTGPVPNWAVNANDFETSMNIIGQVYFNGVVSEDADDILAAFIGEECRGVAYPQYNERYGGYYVTMDIYGSSDENGSGTESGAEVTFRAYDASTGTTYPVVIPGDKWLSNGIFEYSSTGLVGSYVDPIQFNVQNLIEQQIELSTGWNWVSFNVTAADMTVPGLFQKIADDVLTVKSQTGYISPENGTWKGSLTGDLPNHEMYAVQMQADRTLRVIGTSVTTKVPVYWGWNWIAYYGRQMASIGDALGGMKKVNVDPTVIDAIPDMMRAQRGFVYWDEYEWSGSLQIMEPGKGYQLYSNYMEDPNDEDVPQLFSYPVTVLSGAQHSPAIRGPKKAQTCNTFKPVNFRRYPDNAIMTVMVVEDGLPLSGIEVGVFDGEECRTAAITNESGLAYLTIPGDDSCELTFKVVVGVEVKDVPYTITYETDAIYGTPSYPVVFDLGNMTGINTTIQAIGDESVYDLQGRKIGNDKSSIRTLEKGVYIINGQKNVK